MRRISFPKPKFTVLFSSSTSYHLPKDVILIRWEVRHALYVKTSLNKKIHRSRKIIFLSPEEEIQQIVLTAVSLFGSSTAILSLSKSAFSSILKPIPLPLGLRLPKNRLAVDHRFPIRTNVDITLDFHYPSIHQRRNITNQPLAPLPIGKSIHTTRIKLKLPLINIYE